MKIKLTKVESILSLISMLIVFSCTEKDPFPLANASFNVVSNSPERYNEVKFENFSTNAKTYEWDFGDGSEISKVIAPTHTYEESGDFIVSLKAYTEDEQVSTETQVIKIGERYLTGMFIISINMRDSDGMPWDSDGSGPDVLMQFGPAREEIPEDLIEGFFVDSLNVGQFKTPIGIRTSDLLSENYKLTNEDFFILLEEVDSVLENGINVPKFTPMVELQFNPVVIDPEAITEFKREDGSGQMTVAYLPIDQYQFFLEFEIR